MISCEAMEAGIYLRKTHASPQSSPLTAWSCHTAESLQIFPASGHLLGPMANMLLLQLVFSKPWLLSNQSRSASALKSYLLKTKERKESHLFFRREVGKD